MRANLTCNETLAALTQRMGWHYRLRAETSVEERLQNDPKRQADMFEALVHGIHVDLDKAPTYLASEMFVKGLFHQLLRIEADEPASRFQHLSRYINLLSLADMPYGVNNSSISLLIDWSNRRRRDGPFRTIT